MQRAVPQGMRPLTETEIEFVVGGTGQHASLPKSKPAVVLPPWLTRGLPPSPCRSAH